MLMHRINPQSQAKNTHEKEKEDTTKEKLIYWIGAVIIVVTVLGVAAAIVVHFALADTNEEKLITS